MIPRSPRSSAGAASAWPHAWAGTQGKVFVRRARGCFRTRRRGFRAWLAGWLAGLGLGRRERERAHGTWLRRDVTWSFVPPLHVHGHGHGDGTRYPAHGTWHKTHCTGDTVAATCSMTDAASSQTPKTPIAPV